jgi:hypothetical protein
VGEGGHQRHKKALERSSGRPAERERQMAEVRNLESAVMAASEPGYKWIANLYNAQTGVSARQDYYFGVSSRAPRPLVCASDIAILL